MVDVQNLMQKERELNCSLEGQISELQAENWQIAIVK